MKQTRCTECDNPQRIEDEILNVNWLECSKCGRTTLHRPLGPRFKEKTRFTQEAKKLALILFNPGAGLAANLFEGHNSVIKEKQAMEGEISL